MPPALVFVTDNSRRVVHANAPARALFGACTDRHCCELLRADCAPPAEDAEYQEVGHVSANGVVGHATRSAVGEQFVIVVQLRGVVPDALEPLSPREREILQLVARGLTDVDVAERIGVQHSTVRSHMENVRRKLKVRSRSQAVARAHASGIL